VVLLTKKQNACEALLERNLGTNIEQGCSLCFYIFLSWWTNYSLKNIVHLQKA